MTYTIGDALRSGDGNPALLDTATGALSRAALILRLEEAAALATRLGHGVSIVVLDLGRPWALCDAYGPAAVDTVLAGIVDRLWDLARRSDTVARIGPARLAVLLPATERAGAELYASRLLPRLTRAVYQVGDAGVRVRLSVCVVGAEAGEAHTGATLLAIADEAKTTLPPKPCMR